MVREFMRKGGREISAQTNIFQALCEDNALRHPNSSGAPGRIDLTEGNANRAVKQIPSSELD